MIGHQFLQKRFEVLAKENLLGQGYIFFGPEQVGKKLFALSLGRYLEEGVFTEPEGVSFRDTLLLEPEGSSLSIDKVREAKHFLAQKPFSGKRFLIVDQAHTLTPQAQNALLKISEEPPIHSLLILVANDTSLLLPTLVSRLQSVYFGSVPHTEIVSWLMKTHKHATKDAEKATQLSWGRPGRAWSYLHDEDFKKLLTLGEKILREKGKAREELVEYLSLETAEPTKLLDVILSLLYLEKEKTTPSLKTALTMRREMTTFNLHPRLQFDYLVSLL